MKRLNLVKVANELGGPEKTFGKKRANLFRRAKRKLHFDVKDERCNYDGIKKKR